MNRREAIQKATLMLGGVLSAPILAGAMGKTTNKTGFVATSPDQEVFLSELADIIIPATDSPGAKEAGAVFFIVRVMRDCYVKADQEKFYNGLLKFNDSCIKKLSKNFIDLDVAQKNEMVKQLTLDDKDFFLRMRELTITGYFTSELGATKALDYVYIPGKFVGCMPLPKGQKAYAL